MLSTIVATSGLGNRIRVVTSTIKAAELFQKKLRIVWPVTWDCRAAFEDLFQPINHTFVHLENGSWKDLPATKQNLLLPWLYRKTLFKHEWRCYKPNNEEAFSRLLQMDDNFYLDTCYALANYPKEDVSRYFKPQIDLQKSIDHIVESFTGNTLGVHIRRTDNRMAIRFSPLSAFRQKIDQLLECEAFNQIFLCTDDEQVRQYFKKTYGNRLLTRQVEISRDSLLGIQNAVIDLWSLAQTRRIVGSYYSSFSETAAEISGIPLDIIYQQPSTNNIL